MFSLKNGILFGDMLNKLNKKKKYNNQFISYEENLIVEVYFYNV